MTVWPPRRSRSAMLPPMRPSPIMPSVAMALLRRLRWGRAGPTPGSARQADRHEQVAVVGRRAVGRGGVALAGENGRSRRAGERQGRRVAVDRAEPVEQVLRVEGDRERLAGRAALPAALELLAGLGVVGAA